MAPAAKKKKSVKAKTTNTKRKAPKAQVGGAGWRTEINLSQTMMQTTAASGHAKLKETLLIIQENMRSEYEDQIRMLMAGGVSAEDKYEQAVQLSRKYQADLTQIQLFFHRAGRNIDSKFEEFLNTSTLIAQLPRSEKERLFALRKLTANASKGLLRIAKTRA